VPAEKDKIKGQIEEAKEEIERQVSQHEIENPASPKTPIPKVVEAMDTDPTEISNGASEIVGKETDTAHAPILEAETTNNDTPKPSPDIQEKPEKQEEAEKDTGDDGGEVVEGEEDTVIY